MSIYATLIMFERDDYADDPDDPVGTAFGPAPIIYRGSHVLPSDSDDRGGTVSVCAIPGSIEREGRPPVGGELDGTFHPWLRLSVDPDDSGEPATVVLDRAHVNRLYQTFGDWLLMASAESTQRREQEGNVGTTQD